MLLIKKIINKEWPLLALISLTVIIITTAPFIYGQIKTPPGKYYPGFHNLAPGDFFVYYSYILQVYDHHFLFTDLYTQESLSYNMINTFWAFAGFMGRFFNLSVFWAFQLARILSIPILIFSLYLLISRYFLDLKEKITALIFLIFSGGLSAFFLSVFDKNYYNIFGYYHFPMDLWVSESSIFLSMTHSGHMVMSLAFLVLIFYLSLLFLENKKYKYSYWAGFLNLILLSFHPFLAPIIFGVLAIVWLAISLRDRKVNWQLLAHLLIIVFMSLPMLVYYFLMLKFDFVTIQRAAQNICLTPAWYFLFFSFGFLLIFGAVGIYLFFKDKKYFNDQFLFLVAWLVFGLILIYLPFNFQRRLVEGLQIPLTIFAVSGIFYFYNFLKKYKESVFFKFFINNKFIWLFIFIFCFAFSNAHLWQAHFELIDDQNPYFYYPIAEARAMAWVKENLDNKVLILAHPVFTNYLLPGIAGRRVFAGHEVETLFYDQKSIEAKWFLFSNNFDEQKINFLRKNKISHIIYGQFEASLGDFNPKSKEYLSIIYEEAGVSIFKVVLP